MYICIPHNTSPFAYVDAEVDTTDDRSRNFLAWQTWDLLRLMGTIEGFLGLCNDFMTCNPGYFIKPIRVNGSRVIESLFGRFKYNAGGHLSAVNYRGCVAKLTIADAVNATKDSYRGDNCDHKGMLKKQKYKRK